MINFFSCFANHCEKCEDISTYIDENIDSINLRLDSRGLDDMFYEDYAIIKSRLCVFVEMKQKYFPNDNF